MVLMLKGVFFLMVLMFKGVFSFDISSSRSLFNFDVTYLLLARFSANIQMSV